MKTKTIFINWLDEKSIKKAEKEQTRLLNLGYICLHKRTTSGLNTATLLFAKPG